MLGWHFRCHLKQHPGCEAVLADRETFANAEALRRFAAQSDAIIHLAGQNRGPETEVRETNSTIATQLVAACESARVRPHIVYSSTIHIEFETAYGESKKDAGTQLEKWARRNGARFTNVVIPHVFGEGTKPFYNSAVATFAYQLANGEQPKMLKNSVLELIHAQDVCSEMYQVLRTGRSGNVRLHGKSVEVADALSKLQGFAKAYEGHVLPDLRDQFDLKLFNLYRYYLFPSRYPRQIEVHSDDRGQLVEAVKNRSGGQVFFSSSRPGVTRGNHFHYHKLERFLVLKGDAVIRVRRLFDDSVSTFNVCGSLPSYVDIPTLHTHNITNLGDSDMLTLFWANEIFDPENPDTFYEPVEARPITGE